MSAHRMNHRPAPPACTGIETFKDVALAIGIAAGLVLVLLQPFGAVL